MNQISKALKHQILAIFLKKYFVTVFLTNIGAKRNEESCLARISFITL